MLYLSHSGRSRRAVPDHCPDLDQDPCLSQFHERHDLCQRLVRRHSPYQYLCLNQRPDRYQHPDHCHCPCHIADQRRYHRASAADRECHRHRRRSCHHQDHNRNHLRFTVRPDCQRPPSPSASVPSQKKPDRHDLRGGKVLVSTAGVQL